MSELFNLPRIVTDSVPGPKSRDLAARLGEVESPDTTFLSHEFPVFWESAHGCIVRDVDGNSYLDATASFGALAVGHTHPKIVAAIRSQTETLIHGMGDVHPSRIKVELLEKVADLSPIPNPRIILGQSGSEAVEAALKTVYRATGRPGVLAFEGGYHGLTYGALEPTARPSFREPFAAQRGRFARHLPYGCETTAVVEALAEGEPKIGAVIVEPIQGRGGIRIPAAGWLLTVQRACRDAGALLILDEIYTGWGRTGRLFASEWEPGLEPDIVCMGKAMGGGMPISACVGRRDLIDAAWPRSTGEALLTSTFLGHPVACAAAIAAIDVIVTEKLAQRSAEMGERLLTGLQRLAAEHPESVVAARGRGLMTGLDLAGTHGAGRLMLLALGHGLIVLPAGDEGAVIELTPPLIVDEDQIDWCLGCLSGRLDRL